MLTCGTGGTVAVPVHGGRVLVGEQTPPPGGIALAVLLTLAGGFALTVAVTVYVTKLPGGKAAIVSLTAPLPLAVQVAPPLGAHVQVCEAMPCGTGSVTSVASAATAPVLLTVIV